MPLVQSTIGYIDGVNSLNNRGQQTGSITAYGLIPTSTQSVDFSTFRNNKPVYNYNYYIKATNALKEELKNIKIENPFHVECIKLKADEKLIVALEISIIHFEKLEEYEKCALLKDVNVKVKDFLI